MWWIIYFGVGAALILISVRQHSWKDLNDRGPVVLAAAMLIVVLIWPIFIFLNLVRMVARP